jgi:hypothetical protein
MRTVLVVAWCAVVLAIASAGCAQSPAGSGSSTQALLTPGRGLQASMNPSAAGEIVREIDDPHTGDRWLLMRNDANPGGPGRFTLVTAGRTPASGGFAQPANPATPVRLQPVIRLGDRLIVEEHTAVVDARLQARALNSAALGSVFNVRLAIGGRVVRAVALGPGRAALKPETGVRP